MRIVHIINALTVGGAELMLLRTTQELARRGHVVTIVCLRSGDRSVEARVAGYGVRLIQLRAPVYLSFFEFCRLLWREKYDICHSHLFPAMFYGALARRLGFVRRLFHTEHAITNNRRRWWFRGPEYAMLASADAIVAISDAVQCALTMWFPALQKKILVILNPVEVAERKMNYAVGAMLRVVCVGRLVQAKSIPIQLTALQMYERVMVDYFGDGSMRGELTTMARNLGVLQRTHFCGTVYDVLSRYKNYDALVHSASVEGFGLVVGEAMSAGLPVIVAKVPGVREVAGPDALYFEDGNPGSLADCFKGLALMEEKSRRALGQKLADRAGMFALRDHVDRLETIYNNWLSMDLSS